MQIFFDGILFNKKLGVIDTIDEGFCTSIFLMVCVLIGFFFFTMFFALCCCEPDAEVSPKCCLKISNTFVAGMLVISSFIAYAGGSKLTKCYKNSYRNDKKSFNDDIGNQINQNVSAIRLLIDDFTKKNKNPIFTSNSLKELIKKYNSTFSDIDGEYCVSLNNIYSNSETSNYLKFCLKNMEKSRTIVFSKVLSISNEYSQFSEKIQNALKSINEDFFQSTEKMKKMTGETLFQNSIENSEQYKILINFSFIYSSVIIVFAIIYSIIFFYDNKCTRCCSCLYSSFSFLILFAIFVSLIFADKLVPPSDYSSYKYNKQNQRKEIETMLNEVKNFFNKFKIDEKLKKSFNEKERTKIEEIYQSINSKKIHNDYLNIYLQYSNDSSCKKYLTKIVNIIKSREEKLIEIKTKFGDIYNFSFSVYQIYEKALDQTEQLFLETIEHLNDKLISIKKKYKNIKNNKNGIDNDEKFKNKINQKLDEMFGKDDIDLNILSSSKSENYVDGFNCYFISIFLMCINIFFMAIFIWLKRSEKCVNITGRVQVSNAKKQPTELKTTYLGKKIVYSAIYIKSSESISVIVASCSTPDQIVTVIRGKYEKSQSIESCFYRNDKFGEGFYFSATKIEALLELQSLKDHLIDIDKTGFLVCLVDFGNSLEVPQNKHEYFSYPSSLDEYSCNSVSCQRDDLPDEFIVYDIDRIEPINIIPATPQDIQ